MLVKKGSKIAFNCNVGKKRGRLHNHHTGKYCFVYFLLLLVVNKTDQGISDLCFFFLPRLFYINDSIDEDRKVI